MIDGGNTIIANISEPQPMKRIIFTLLVICVGLWLKSCTAPPQLKRNLSARMTGPIESDSLFYSDDEISILFAFRSSDVSFLIKNKTQNTLRVVWDESAFVINGMTQRVGHKDIRMNDIGLSHAPSIIPAGTSSLDILVPVEAKEQVTNIYSPPSKNMFTHSEGQYNVGALLGLTVNGRFKEYYFTFDVSYAEILTNTNYTTVKLENNYENSHVARSSRSLIQTWNLLHSVLKERGFKIVSENDANYSIVATNNSLKNSYSAEKGKGQLTSYDKYVVVSRCYSKSKDVYAAVSDLKGTWLIQLRQDEKGVVVEAKLDTYSITRRTPDGVVCTDAEVRSTGVFEKQIAEKLK